jgi:hypothetical protein
MLVVQNSKNDLCACSADVAFAAISPEECYSMKMFAAESWGVFVATSPEDLIIADSAEAGLSELGVYVATPPEEVLLNRIRLVK